MHKHYSIIHFPENCANAICWNCSGMQPMKERYSYKDISVQLMNGSSDGGAEKAYSTALDRFTAQLAEDHVIRVVDMVRIEPERVKKKNATAIYRYQADCDGEWGEIQFDFKKRKAEILQLADWDTSRTKLYAKRAIDCILRTGGSDLPKKRESFSRDNEDASLRRDGGVICLLLPR